MISDGLFETKILRWLYGLGTANAWLPHIAGAVPFGRQKVAIRFLYRAAETAQYF